MPEAEGGEEEAMLDNYYCSFKRRNQAGVYQKFPFLHHLGYVVVQAETGTGAVLIARLLFDDALRGVTSEEQFVKFMYPGGELGVYRSGTGWVRTAKQQSRGGN